jgi:hypothetical protein
MPDIREVLNALDEEDKRLWTIHRTEMRRSYLTAHNAVLGIHTWNSSDDMFMDYIDIKLALLFDQSGRTQTSKTIVTEADAKKVEQALTEAANKANGLKPNPDQPSAATQMMQNGWSSQVPAVRN